MNLHDLEVTFSAGEESQDNKVDHGQQGSNKKRVKVVKGQQCSTTCRSKHGKASYSCGCRNEDDTGSEKSTGRHIIEPRSRI